MANTGRVCILGDDAVVTRTFVFSLQEWVAAHPSLKNLDVAWDPMIPIGRYNGPAVVHGECDRITPENASEFLKEYKTPGVRLFITDSTYGDHWEEVLA